jgi:hypothetical protein
MLACGAGRRSAGEDGGTTVGFVGDVSVQIVLGRYVLSMCCFV